MERDTIRRIREAVRTGRLGKTFTAIEVNKVLKIWWAGTFLPKHRVGNPGGYTELFIRIKVGVYRLNPSQLTARLCDTRRRATRSKP